jgi:hypothetical protein
MRTESDNAECGITFPLSTPRHITWLANAERSNRHIPRAVFHALAEQMRAFDLFRARNINGRLVRQEQ